MRPFQAGLRQVLFPKDSEFSEVSETVLITFDKFFQNSDKEAARTKKHQTNIKHKNKNNTISDTIVQRPSRYGLRMF